MPAPSPRARREIDRRRALARALWHENEFEQHVVSAHRFIRRLPDSYKSALSQYLGVEAPNGVLDAMKTPSFWHWGVVYRLCLWGWSPDTESDGLTDPSAGGSGGGPVGDGGDTGDLTRPRTLMPPLRGIDHGR
jgi:hypothetical protein